MSSQNKKPLPKWRKRLSIFLWIVLLGYIVTLVLSSPSGVQVFSALYKYGFTSKGYHEMLRTSNDPDVRFGNFSSDGTKVVLNYRPTINNEEDISYIGILDISTGHLDLIRSPLKYKLWYDGSFSPDGKKMVFSYSLKNNVQERFGLGMFNLDTWNYETILKSDAGRKYLSFSPDSKGIIYFKREYVKAKDEKMLEQGTDIYAMDLKTKKESRLSYLHFHGGRSAPRYFPDGEMYIVAAEYPYSDDSSWQEYSKLYQDNNTYIFNRNNPPSQAIPAIMHKDHSRFEDISADGKKILCTAISDLHKTNQQGKYNYELFMYENNQMNQLTDLQWMIIDATLSPDAKKAVFVADTLPSRGSERQIWLLDIDKNTTSRIKIKPEDITWIDVE